MKKILGISTAVGTFLTLAPFAFAATTDTLCPGTTSDFKGLCSLKISGVIGPLINLIFIVAVIAALLYLVWGGFKWLTSGGDKGGVQAAREHIIAAVIGLVVIFLSYFILQIIIGFFVPNFTFSDFQLPVIGNPAVPASPGGP